MYKTNCTVDLSSQAKSFLRVSSAVLLVLLLLMTTTPVLYASSQPSSIPVQDSLAQEKNRAAAQQIFEEAEKLRIQATAESRQQAIKKYEEALPLFHSLGHKKSVATIHNNLGESYFMLGQLRKALDSFNQALALFQELKDPTGEAGALTNLGTVSNNLGDNQKALIYYEQAVPIFRSLNMTLESAYLLNNMGVLYSSLSNFQKAIDSLNEALPLVRKFDDKKMEATILNNLAFDYSNLGDKQNALDTFKKALIIFRVVDDKRGEAGALHNIGNIYGQVGDYQKLMDYLKEALPIIKITGDRKMESSTLNMMGTAYWRLGDMPKAIEYFEKSLAIQRAVGNRLGEAEILNNLAFTFDSLGDKAKALEIHNQSLLIKEAIGDLRGKALTLNNLGGIYKNLSELQKAFDFYTQALQIGRKISEQSLVFTTLQNLAVLERNRHNYVQAHAYIKEEIELLESSRRTFKTQELRTSFSSLVHKAYETNIDILMQLHKIQPLEKLDIQAFQSSDAARARSLLELLKENRADILEGVDRKLREQERAVRQLLNARGEHQVRLLSSKHTPEQKAALEKEVRDLTTQYEEVLAEIRTKNPRYAAITQPKPLSLAEIQKEVLDDDTLLLEFSLGDERSYLWAVSKDSLNSYELPPRQQIEAAAKRFTKLITDYQDTNQENLKERLARYARLNRELPIASAELSRMLLAPVANLLGSKRLLIVPDGILHYVPFAALTDPVATVSSRKKAVGTIERTVGVENAGSWQKVVSSSHTRGNGRRTTDDGQPLLVNHEIVSLPSASVLAVIRRETKERVKPPKTVAIFADPVFDENDSRVSDAKNAAAQGKTVVPSAAKRSATKKPVSLQPATKGQALTRNAVQEIPTTHAKMQGQSPHQATVQADSAKQTTATANSAKQVLIKEASATKPLETKANDEVENLKRQRALRSAVDTRGALARLYFSRDEAQAIYKLVGKESGLLKLDFTANLQTALDENLAQYTIIHFSTHGILNSQQPELSGIVLSLVDEQGKRREGFLGLADIFNMKLPVELVTLSACETALGKELKGEGLVGVTRGFMYAGAKRVVASLWKVQDRATAKLMTDFYTNVLNGKRPAEALRKAQLNLLHSKSHRSPFYWAGFVLQGEWR